MERAVPGSRDGELAYYDIQIAPLVASDLLRNELERSRQELETANEELQSTNEELETINTELRERTGQLNEANTYLEAVLSSLQAAIVVLDLDLAVRGWNTMAYELWGLQPDEVMHRHLLSLDIGLPVDRLREPVRLCLSGVSAYDELVLEASNRRGRRFDCKVSWAPMRGGDGELSGIILLMESLQPPAERP